MKRAVPPGLRILALANDIPSPSATGLRMRLLNALRALSEIGVVDFFAIVDPVPSGPEPMPGGLDITRHLVVSRPTLDEGRLASPTLPSDFARRDYSSVRQAFQRWATAPYDLVWYGRLEPYVALSPQIDAPAVLDLDDLEDRKIRGRQQAGWSRSLVPEAAATGGAAWGGWDDDAERWARLQHRAAREVACVVLCSELDRRRFGEPNVVVVPNGYERPAHPAGRTSVGPGTTILFAGYLRYEPNIDAAQVLVDDVLPLLRLRRPEVTIRLVGINDGQIRSFADRPGVVVTGPVPDMTAELRSADLVAVPIRFGSGTRVKIVEALAHRIPVVTTTMGCEGLDVRDGHHLLIRDSLEGFAAACEDALSDEGLRERLTGAGHQVYLERYESSLLRAGISHIARRVAGNSGALRRIDA
ncbi:MAG: glycosyltransferase family 4 protein [Actinomycetota bacterium]|nr:glycosyltransferase family 4 protein [Actinomycetota bacterium]